MEDHTHHTHTNHVADGMEIDLMSGGENRTPITVITGFLGAGKTTLVNYILKEQQGWRIAVIENEFGEIPIDDGLVAGSIAEPEDLMVMDNGCVCCTVRGDLVRTLGQLVTRRHEVQAILLETTGVADPAPIIHTIQTLPHLNMHYRIDSVICLTDCKSAHLHLDEIKPDGAVNEAQHQVAFADKILLNKVDLVTHYQKEELKKRIRGLNTFAAIIETQRSRVPLEKILNTNSYNVDSILSVDPTFFEDDEKKAATGLKKEHRLDLVQSVGLKFEGNLNFEWFHKFMVGLLNERSKDLYRTKGVLSFHGQGNKKFVFQGVHEQINFGPASEEWKDGEPRVNKFVFIGRDLDRAELMQYLKECLHRYG